ncbi:MAG: N-carbamoylputrescine amidase, partial [Myxococcales bacterium]|nr:N-carbamoylputrescine amidase [Myxococcales bacterium]
MGAVPKREVALGLIQSRVGVDLDANVEAAVARVRQAADRGAQVIVLQELYRAPYPAQSEDADRFDWAEPVPGPSTEAMGKIARERGVAIVVPVFERRGPGLYHNSVAVMNPDGALAGLYRKSHIPDDPAYYEKFYFAPGDTGVQVIETPFCRLAPLICWDQWFPEAARLAALGGA